jgi:hypothetical protein
MQHPELSHPHIAADVARLASNSWKMSALGQTFKATKVMSALPLKADFCSALVLLWAKSGDCLATLEPSHYH